MLNIVTVNYYLKGDRVVNTEIDGNETLLDADIVIFDPSAFEEIWSSSISRLDDGVARLFSPHSDRIINTFESRRNEVETLLDSGKIIVVFMHPLSGVLAEKQNKGNYNPFTSYDFLPLRQNFFLEKLKSGVSSSSDSIKHISGKNLFSPFFGAFKDELQYQAYLDLDPKDEKSFFLLNRANKPVGATLKFSNGIVALFPPIKYNRENQKLLGVLQGIGKKFITNHVATPPPGWTTDFNIQGESELDGALEELNRALNELKEQKIEIENKRKEITKYRGLLYEQGTALEELVISSFKLMGFEAENRKLDDLEHDVVFKSPEGQGIAEIEGKDNDAVHISKLDQLNRAVDEDFALTDEYPQGVLIGNHYRLTNPKQRKEAFTDKVKIVAAKKSFGLLTTYQLFLAVQKISEDPSNNELKKDFRTKILTTEGKEIQLVSEN
ncbi:MAG: hypothetical protein ABJG68_14985 [Crocinitomicaceae bacterium]